MNHATPSRLMIAPSLLTADFTQLDREVESLGEIDLLHLDVMDGNFVPQLSFGLPVIASLRKRFPHHVLDTHLMISNPSACIDDYIEAGSDRISIHVEACADPATTLDRIRSGGAIAGLALSPQTPIERLEKTWRNADFILVMSVEPGLGGQRFLPQTPQRLADIRALVDNQIPLAVDGGINSTTIAAAAASGASIFIAGSAVLSQPDRVHALVALRDAAHAALNPDRNDNRAPSRVESDLPARPFMAA